MLLLFSQLGVLDIGGCLWEMQWLSMLAACSNLLKNVLKNEDARLTLRIIQFNWFVLGPAPVYFKMILRWLLCCLHRKPQRQFYVTEIPGDSDILHKLLFSIVTCNLSFPSPVLQLSVDSVGPTVSQEISSCLCQPGFLWLIIKEPYLTLKSNWHSRATGGWWRQERRLACDKAPSHAPLLVREESHPKVQESPMIPACCYEHSYLTPLSMGRTCNLSGRQNNVPQRCPHPNPQNLWVCYLTWQKGLCRCDQE